MKKLFFYSNMRTYDETAGITRKVKEEIEAFSELKYNVYYSGYLENGIGIFNKDKLILFKKYFFKNEKINHILRRYMLIMFCIKFVSNKNFDIAYLRYHFFDYLYLKLLKRLKKNGAKVIIEAHAYPSLPKASQFNPIKILDDFYSKYAYHYTDLIASMTDYKKMWNIPTYEIDNTLDIKKYKLKEYVPLNDEFIMVNIAFENVAHGFDRLIKGLSEYKKEKLKIKVRVICIGEYSKQTKRLVKQLKLEDSVIFVGKKNRDEINEFIDKSHFAVGSFGNHRFNSFYGSALKTKEYMARGIPFIYGWNEKILKNFKNAYKVPLDETPIKIKEVIDFYKNIEHKNLSYKIRNYLVNNNQPWEEQYKKMLTFMTRGGNFEDSI